MTATDHSRYAEWDAAYVLGSLSPAERRDYEGHLEDCKLCRAAVAELSALPGLLGRLGDARAFALLDEDGETAAPPADLVARIERADRGRRIRRIVGTAAGVAAAAALATVLALVVPPMVAPASSPAVASELTAVRDSVPVAANVALTPVGWGTRIDMDCSYHPVAGPDGGYGPAEYGMWVVARDGSESALSTWSSEPGGTVEVTAGTALALAEIATVQLRASDGETVLLAADLAG